MRTLQVIQKITNPFFITPGFLILFGISFFPRHTAITNGAFVIFSVLPFTAGLVLGIRLGLVYWFLHSVLLFILTPLVGQSVDDLISSGLATYFATLILTLGVGKIRDLTIALRHELKERKKYENEFRLCRDELENIVKKRTLEIV